MKKLLLITTMLFATDANAALVDITFHTQNGSKLELKGDEQIAVRWKDFQCATIPALNYSAVNEVYCGNGDEMPEIREKIKLLIKAWRDEQ